MSQSQETSLAENQSPLILPDGSEVYPAEAAPTEQNFIEVPTATDAVRQVMSTRRSIADMPAPPKQMNAISVVVAYKMFGLSDPDIALSTGMNLEQVERMQMLDAFDEMWSAAIANVIQADTDDIEQLIHQSARNAVNRITHVNSNAVDPFAIIASSKDLLDRHERTRDRRDNKEDNALRIEIIRKDETEEQPEMEFVDGNS
jgi:hypothetical protein